MDIEKIKQQQQESLAKLAVTQIPNFVGQGVLRLLQQGQPLSVETLVESMRQPVAHLSEQDWGRKAVEVSIAALQDAAKPK
jgi:hypothetical protein